MDHKQGKKYKNKEVLVLGFGRTGKSVTKFLKKLKAVIYIWDDNFEVRSFNSKKFKIYNSLKKKVSDFNFIFVSPGISKNHPILQKATKQKIFLTSDIELFWEKKLEKNKSSSVVGITGTNGKSTIALMVSNVLKTKPLGNFGNPVLDFSNFKEKNFVIELSSFQLEYIKQFKSNISII